MTSSNVGIGVSGPSQPLQIQSGTIYDGILLQNASNPIATLQGNSASNENGTLQLYVSGTPQVLMRASGSSYITGGNLGIGTTSPPYLLSVKGTMGAGEVIVTDTSGWPDFVFDADHRLTPLTQLSEYIKANHHLPEIPSASEVQEKGIKVGEMQSKLLAKIEELTLHMIEAEKVNKDLRERLEHVEQEQRHASRR